MIARTGELMAFFLVHAQVQLVSLEEFILTPSGDCGSAMTARRSSPQQMGKP